MFSKMQKYALVGRLRILLTGLANFLNPFLSSLLHLVADFEYHTRVTDELCSY